MIRKQKTKIGAPGDYAKFEIAVIKQLAKLLKQPYKKTAATINTDNTLLKVISDNFDKGISVKETAKQVKAALIAKTEKAKTPAQAFIELLSKLPKKEQPKNSASFPMKLPATVTIGNNHTDTKSHNVKINVLSGLEDIKTTQVYINKCMDLINALDTDIIVLRRALKGMDKNGNKLPPGTFVNKREIGAILSTRLKQQKSAIKTLNTFAKFKFI